MAAREDVGVQQESCFLREIQPTCYKEVAVQTLLIEEADRE
jgi:hypothetical protein